ncbi:MAG: DNA replication protein DnaC [Myxococcota bacterium]|jgi:DNA replication protein DnaC
MKAPLARPPDPIHLLSALCVRALPLSAPGSLTMPARFFPSAKDNCGDCQGMGYVVRPVRELSIASICECVPACPRCNSTGRVQVETDGLVRVGRCRCQMMPDRIRLFNAANIPARHASSSFMSFDTTADGVMPAFFAAMSWVQDFQPAEENQGMVFWGPVGRGKTHLLIATLRHLIFQHGVPGRFIEFSRLLGELKEGYSAGRSDSAVLEKLADVPVLCIDELGKGRLSDWELTIIDEVVSRRYNGMGCVLGTSNYRPGSPTGSPPPNLAKPEFESQTLGDRVGWRVFSRLQQMCTFVQTRGEDYRRLKGKRLRQAGPRLAPVPAERR